MQVEQSFRVQLLTPAGAMELREFLIRGLHTVPRFEELYTIEWVAEQISRGHLQVWCFGVEGVQEPELVLFTQVAAFPKKKVVEIMWAFGSGVRKYWDVASDCMDRFAREIGAKEVAIVGRKAWGRILRDKGAIRQNEVWVRDVGIRRVQ